MRRLAWLLLLVLVPGLLVQVERGRAALSSPSTAVTSGCEEESFYAIWRGNQGTSPYIESTRPPYATAYFNWLFYKAYSAVSSGHPDAAIPFWGRITTLAGALTALACCSWVFTLGGSPLRLAWSFLTGLALFSSGLFGWWLFTVRPDVWALTFEIGAVTWFLAFHPRRDWIATGGAIVLTYAAWSFKQANVAVAGTLILYLARQREWRLLMAFAGGFSLLLAITLLAGGPIYRANLASAASGFEVALGWTNLLHATVRALPLSLLPVYAVALWLGDERKPWTPAAPAGVQFALIGLVVSGTLAFVASFKAGASHNYYFTAAFFAALLGVQSRLALQNRRYQRAGDLAVGAGLAVACLLAGLQFSGRLGTLTLTSANTELARRLEVWQALPAPRFSEDRRLALPWLNPGMPPFIPAFNYPADRARHRAFEYDGVGGLIRDGYFAALLLPETTTGEYDGARLSDHYERKALAAGMAVFQRKSDPPVPLGR